MASPSTVARTYTGSQFPPHGRTLASDDAVAFPRGRKDSGLQVDSLLACGRGRLVGYQRVGDLPRGRRSLARRSTSTALRNSIPRLNPRIAVFQSSESLSGRRPFACRNESAGIGLNPVLPCVAAMN